MTAALVVELSYLISGAVVVEVPAAVFAIGVVVIVVNVLGDALLRVLDPRTGRAAA